MNTFVGRWAMGAAMLSICGVASLGLIATMGGCQKASIAMWEKLGYAKRDQLVEKVKEARDSQEAAKAQFQTALEQFQALTGFQGGELESKYKKLQREYDRCKAAAETVGTRISKTQGVAGALFGEWERELGQYQDASLRASSQRQLDETRGSYDRLISAMRTAESKMDPVLRALNDRVLFLKHNLNAQAIASLSGDVRMIEGDVARLISEMNAAISEADAFIGKMK
jgi:hypothetical protein